MLARGGKSGAHFYRHEPHPRALELDVLLLLQPPAGGVVLAGGPEMEAAAVVAGDVPQALDPHAVAFVAAVVDQVVRADVTLDDRARAAREVVGAAHVEVRDSGRAPAADHA